MAKDRGSSPLFILVAMLTAVAALYFAKAILLPLAFAILLSFLLTPLADRLERWRLPRIVAVLAIVAMSFAVLGGLGWIVTNQLVDLGRQLPVHKHNLIAKIQSLRPSSTTITKVSETLTDLRNELVHGGKKKGHGKGKADTQPAADVTQPQEQQPPAKGPAEAPSLSEDAAASVAESGKMDEPSSESEAVPVKVVELPPSPLESIQGWLGPLIAPFTTAGMVFILVLFMLLDREGQRSRLIQLFGRSHLHTTTEAIQDVGKRVGGYLRTLFLVNAGYGVVIAAGLWLIGVPGAMTWAHWHSRCGSFLISDRGSPPRCPYLFPSRPLPAGPNPCWFSDGTSLWSWSFIISSNRWFTAVSSVFRRWESSLRQSFGPGCGGHSDSS